GKHELAAFEAVNHHTGDFRAYRRTAVAAPYAPMTADPAGIHIVSRMNDDGALTRKIIETGLEPIHAQGGSVLTDVAFLGPEKSDTGLMPSLDIGKLAGLVRPRTVAGGQP